MTAIDDEQAASEPRNGPDAQQRARMRELEAELERYRQASEDALQQLDWCIGYLHGSNRVPIARSLAQNRAFIRTRLLRRPEEPVPSQRAA